MTCSMHSGQFITPHDNEFSMCEDVCLDQMEGKGVKKKNCLLRLVKHKNLIKSCRDILSAAVKFLMCAKYTVILVSGTGILDNLLL